MPLTPVLFTGDQKGRIYLFFDWDSVYHVQIDACLEAAHDCSSFP